MIGRLTVTRGLPGSGKSTWAMMQVRANPTTTTRVNRDDLRAMMHDSTWSGKNEEIVVTARDAIISAALERGHHVICDDTNLAPRGLQHLLDLADGHPRCASFALKDFMHVPLEECIRRDAARDRTVGEEVILRLLSTYRPWSPVRETVG